MTPDIVTMVFFAVASTLLILEMDIGSYLLVPAALSAVIGGVLNAWLFLTRIAPR